MSRGHRVLLAGGRFSLPHGEQRASGTPLIDWGVGLVGGPFFVLLFLLLARKIVFL